MAPYAVLILLPIILALINPNYNKKNNNDRYKRLLIVFMWLALFFMIAFRSKFVGSTDSYHYYDFWKDLSHTSWAKVPEYIDSTGMEALFCYTVWIFSHIFSSPQWIFALTGLLFSISVCRFIYKHSEDMVLSFVMYVTLGLYTFMIQGMRQAIAMSIILFAIDFCIKKKFIRFVLLVLLAAAFHGSAIIFLPMFFVYGLTIKKGTMFIFLAGAGTIFACSPLIVRLGNQLFEREYSETFESGGLIAVSIYILIICAALLFGSKRYDDKKFSFFFYMTFIGSVFYIMRYTGVDVAERVSYYFMFGQMFLLPSTLNVFVAKERWISKIVVYILCIALFLYRLRGSNLVPFEFFWQA